MLMTPVLGFFSARMARGKNVLAPVRQSFIIAALASVTWVLWGHSLSFGQTVGGSSGGLRFVRFTNVGQEPNGADAATAPHLAFAI